MQNPDQTKPTTVDRTLPLLSILGAAAWFGLVTGLVEGAGLWLVQELGWTSWNVSLWGVSSGILWICPLLDFVLFEFVALLMMAVSRFVPRLPVMRYAVFSFAFLMALDWFGFTDRIHYVGTFFIALGVAVVLTRWCTKHESGTSAFWRRTVPWVAATVLLVFASTQGGDWLRERLAIHALVSPPPGAPNIIVIIVDGLRADHISAYGYSRRTSPTMDRLVQEGAAFENAVSASSWSLPSHTTLLTGRYLYEHGAEHFSYDGRYPTIGEVLQGRGYRTAAFSANTFWFTRPRGLGRGFIHFEDFFSSLADMAVRTFYGRKFYWHVLRRGGYDDYPARKRADDVTRSALSWIARQRNRPFCIYFNYFDVHDPYLPPQPFRSLFSKVKNPGGKVNGWMWRLGFNPPLTPEQTQGEIAAYDGGVFYVDQAIGRLLDGLKAYGLAGNTILVITSDHGQELGERNRWAHPDFLYREQVRVPLIFWAPGRIPAGVRVTRPISFADLPATLLDLAGVKGVSTIPGHSLARLWEAPQSQADWAYPLAEVVHYGAGFQRMDTTRSLLTPEWQFIVNSRRGIELYDWSHDPAEQNNLAGTPEGQGLVRNFQGILNGLIARPRSSAQTRALPERSQVSPERESKPHP